MFQQISSFVPQFIQPYIVDMNFFQHNWTKYKLTQTFFLFHDIMEHMAQDEIEDLSLSPPTVGSMQIAGSNGFGHNIEFMSQAYLRNRSSKIDIEVEHDTSIAHIDQPLPIYLKVLFLLNSPSLAC